MQKIPCLPMARIIPQNTLTQESTIKTMKTDQNIYPLILLKMNDFVKRSKIWTWKNQIAEK